MTQRTFDLNKPEDARAYVLLWVDQDALQYGAPIEMLNGTDEDFIRVAKQLFLYADKRNTVGDGH